MQRHAATLIIILMLWGDWVFAQTVFLVAGDEYIPVTACSDGVRMSVYHQHIKEITYKDGGAEISSVLVPERMGSVWVSSRCFGEERLGSLVHVRVTFTDGTTTDFAFDVDADLLLGYKKIPFVREMDNSRQTFTIRAVNNRVYDYSLTRPPKIDEFKEFNWRPVSSAASTEPKGKIIPLAPFQGGVGK